jgi:hypothetical protein
MKKESLTKQVHEALCTRWKTQVAAGSIRPSEYAMSAADQSLARSLVITGHKAKMTDEQILEYARRT